MCEHVLKTITKRTITYVAFWLKDQECPTVFVRVVIRFTIALHWDFLVGHFRASPFADSRVGTVALRGRGGSRAFTSQRRHG